MRAFRTGHVSTRLSDTGAFRLMIVLAVIVAMSVPLGAGAGMARLNEAELQAAELDLTGQVTDSVTGDPIEGAWVAAWWYEDRDSPVIFEELGETYTDVNGNYVLQDGLQFGSGWYEVFAEADGYASLDDSIWVQWDGIEPLVLDFELDWLSTAAFTPPAPNGNNGWYIIKSPAVTIESNDDDRVDYLQWKLNEGDWTTGTTVTGIVDGEHTLYHRAIEKDASVEPTREVSFKVDTVPPVTTTDVQPTYVGSATIILTPADATSGVASTFYILTAARRQRTRNPSSWMSPAATTLVTGARTMRATRRHSRRYSSRSPRMVRSPTRSRTPQAPVALSAVRVRKPLSLAVPVQRSPRCRMPDTTSSSGQTTS
jgi:hypothetical protein